MAPLLEVQHICRSFDGIKAVEAVTFSIQAGTISSIIGANGAGKTTLFNIIGGFIRQDSGCIRYKGEPIDALSPAQRAVIGLGRLWQDGRLFTNMTVIDNLLVAKKKHQGEKILHTILHWKDVREEEAENFEGAEKILRLINLDHKRNSLAKDLSYGQQKLLTLGRLLMNGAELLLLDEIMTGLNPLMIDEIVNLIKGLVAVGKTALMIEHNVPRALEISDRTYVMNNGRVAISGSPSEVYAHPLLREMYLGV
ncbi:MAG: ABC transporter ATP-binding protein [Acidobacteria bacterium]|nr:ABC transporter ATP-binding protein [Acidobacteriota bacterium]